MKFNNDDINIMKYLVHKKFGYGIEQVKEELDADYNIKNDKRAMDGKRVLEGIE